MPFQFWDLDDLVQHPHYMAAVHEVAKELDTT